MDDDISKTRPHSRPGVGRGDRERSANSCCESCRWRCCGGSSECSGSWGCWRRFLRGRAPQSAPGVGFLTCWGGRAAVRCQARSCPMACRVHVRRTRVVQATVAAARSAFLWVLVSWGRPCFAHSPSTHHMRLGELGEMPLSHRRRVHHVPCLVSFVS